MSEYRGFTETGKYRFGVTEYVISSEIKGSKLVEWRKKIFSDDTKDVLERMRRGEEITQEILETSLVGFNYAKALEEAHPTELEGAAGEIFTFLYLRRPEREIDLLKKRLKEDT